MQSHLGEVTLDQKIRQFQERYEKINTLVGDASLLNLSYEADVMNDPTAGYRRICSFLNVKPIHREVPLRPTTNKPLSEVIEDFDAVRAMLESTQNAWMLDAAAAPTT